MSLQATSLDDQSVQGTSVYKSLPFSSTAAIAWSERRGWPIRGDRGAIVLSFGRGKSAVRAPSDPSAGDFVMMLLLCSIAAFGERSGRVPWRCGTSRSCRSHLAANQSRRSNSPCRSRRHLVQRKPKDAQRFDSFREMVKVDRFADIAVRAEGITVLDVLFFFGRCEDDDWNMSGQSFCANSTQHVEPAHLG